MVMPPSVPLDAHTLLAQLAHDGIDALLLDRAQAVGRNAQAHPALLRLEPETLRVKVRQEAPAALVVRVGYAVADGRALARDLAHSGHDRDLTSSVTRLHRGRARAGRALYQPKPRAARRGPGGA